MTSPFFLTFYVRKAKIVPLFERNPKENGKRRNFD